MSARIFALGIAAASLIFLSSQSSAQTNSESAPEDIEVMMQSMTGVMGDMYGNLVRSSAAALAEPGTAKSLAQFSRNYFNELVAAGFSKEEALQIVIGIGIPFSATGQ